MTTLTHRRITVIAGMIILTVGGIITYQLSTSVPTSGDSSLADTGKKASAASPHASTAHEQAPAHSSSGQVPQTPEDKPSGNITNAANTSDARPGPAVTKASQRDVIDTPTGRKTVIDPMASWGEAPPWPEGPRLFADVETSNKKYVNLRPNQIGMMPRLNVAASETIAITLSLPESEPGSRIFLELTNGGGYPGESAKGKVVKVGPKRTVSFSVTADAARGNCTVNIRQAGHNSTLPLWVGEPEALASDDTVSK